jgi:glutathione peroxidase
MSAHDFEFTSIDGKPMKMSAFAGKPVLVVNTASRCGLTPQYADLQALAEKYGDRLVVLGVPSNDFGGQEPGSEGEIKAFCSANYKVYKWAAVQGGEAPKWNFHKYLIGADGMLAATFGSKVSPADPALAAAIDAALKE